MRRMVRERLETLMREAGVDPARGWGMTLAEFVAWRKGRR